jgi:hypothetical protein
MAGRQQGKDIGDYRDQEQDKPNTIDQPPSSDSKEQKNTSENNYPPVFILHSRPSSHKASPRQLASLAHSVPRTGMGRLVHISVDAGAVAERSRIGVALEDRRGLASAGA